MEIKKIKDYFLSGSSCLCVAGMVATIISVLWQILKASFGLGFVKVYAIEIILLIAGPFLLLITIKRTIKTHSLLSKLKRDSSINEVYFALNDTTGNICFNENEVIISYKYLIIKDAVAIIPYQQLTKVYIKYINNDKKEITAVQLYCDTDKKKKILIFPNIRLKQTLILFVEKLKEKNPNIIFEL